MHLLLQHLISNYKAAGFPEWSEDLWTSCLLLSKLPSRHEASEHKPRAKGLYPHCYLSNTRSHRGPFPLICPAIKTHNLYQNDMWALISIYWPPPKKRDFLTFLSTILILTQYTRVRLKWFIIYLIIWKIYFNTFSLKVLSLIGWFMPVITDRSTQTLKSLNFHSNLLLQETIKM